MILRFIISLSIWLFCYEVSPLLATEYNLVREVQIKENEAWIATDNGLLFWDVQTDSVKYYNQQDGLPNNDIIKVLFDNQEKIWVSTAGGLALLTNSGWVHWPENSDIGSEVSDLFVDRDNRIWVAIPQFIGCFFEDEWHIEHFEELIAGGKFFQANNGDIWYNGSFSLHRFSNGQWGVWTLEDLGFSNELNSVVTIAEDKESNIWIGTVFGYVGRFDGDSWRSWSQEDGLVYNDQILETVVTAIQGLFSDEENNIWSWGYNGLNLFNGNSWQDLGLSITPLLDITTDQLNTVWIAARPVFGNNLFIAHFEDAGWIIHEETFDIEPRRIHVDGKNRIWGVGNKGILLYDEGVWQSWPIEIRFSEIFEGPNNEVWLIGHGSLAQYHGGNWVIWPLSEIGLSQEGRDLEIRFDAQGSVIIYGEKDVAFFNGTGWRLLSKVILDVPTGVQDIPQWPNSIDLFQNQPNPFNSQTHIRYTLSFSSQVNLTIYDTLGQLIRHVIDHQAQDAGHYQIVWDGKDANGNIVASGVYLYRLRIGDFTETKKMVFNK